MSLGKYLKAQADIAKKQYQELEDTCEFDKIIKEKNQPEQIRSKI